MTKMNRGSIATIVDQNQIWYLHGQTGWVSSRSGATEFYDNESAHRAVRRFQPNVPVTVRALKAKAET